MKRILSILFFAFFLFLFLPSIALSYSQSDFDNAFQGYVSSSAKYTADLKQYELSISKYLSFKSIAAEDEAIKAAKIMMESKVDFIVKYLETVRIKFALETSILNYQENLLFIQLDNDITSYSNTAGLINDGQTLVDLDKIDLDLKNKYLNSQKLAFKALGLIEYVKKSNFLESLKKQTANLKLKLEEISKVSEYDFTSFNRRIELIEENIKSLESNLNLEKKQYLETIEDNGDKMNIVFSNFSDSSDKVFSETGLLIPNLEEIVYYLLKLS